MVPGGWVVLAGLLVVVFASAVAVHLVLVGFRVLFVGGGRLALGRVLLLGWRALELLHVDARVFLVGFVGELAFFGLAGRSGTATGARWRLASLWVVAAAVFGVATALRRIAARVALRRTPAAAHEAFSILVVLILRWDETLLFELVRGLFSASGTAIVGLLRRVRRLLAFPLLIIFLAWCLLYLDRHLCLLTRNGSRLTPLGALGIFQLIRPCIVREEVVFVVLEGEEFSHLLFPLNRRLCRMLMIIIELIKRQFFRFASRWPLAEEGVLEAVGRTDPLVEVVEKHFAEQVEPAIGHVGARDARLLTFLFGVALVDLGLDVLAQFVRLVPLVGVEAAVIIVCYFLFDTGHGFFGRCPTYGED